MMQDITIKILPQAHNFSQLIVDFPWSLKELITDLEVENWKPYGMETAVQHDEWAGKRYKCHRPKSEKLQDIVNYFARDDVREYVVDCLYRDKPDLTVNWQMHPWRMAMNTQLHAEFTKDLPGFENGVHCDMRRLAATGMIYLCNGDNPDIASAFYDHPDRWSPQRITTGYGLGWVHSNDWNTWHDGWNRSDQTRYSILLALTLKLEHQPCADDTPGKPTLNE